MTPLLAALTDREEQVLLHLAEGFGVREIGSRLGISHRTVRHHRENACRKLGAVNQVQAVAMVVSARARAVATVA